MFGVGCWGAVLKRVIRVSEILLALETENSETKVNKLTAIF